MIYLKLHGALGNQMFQYAYTYALKEKYYPDEEIILCLEDIKKNDYKYQLDLLNIGNVKLQDEFPIPWYDSLVRILLEPFKQIALRIERNKGTKMLNVLWKLENWLGLYCGGETYFYLESIKSWRKNKYCSGLFECDKYFENIKPELLRMYTAKEKANPDNKELYKHIKESESICVTIRRGDFLSEKYKAVHSVCMEKYFYMGVEKIRKVYPDSKVFVFSDDIGWCRRYMDFGDDTEYESGNDSVAEKIRLMSACKHFVLSNSTFSWWVQYLSENDKKLVISPYPWKKKEDHSDIYEDKFVIIDAETLENVVGI